MKSRLALRELVVSIGLSAALAGCGADAGPAEDGAAPEPEPADAGPAEDGSTAEPEPADAGPVEDGSTAEPEPAASAPTAQMLSILDEREGYAQHTYGGQDGTVYHVTTTEDSGNGSLRKALESDDDLWIVFDVEGDITLQSEIKPKSNKTIDARGKHIQIKTNSQFTTAFKIDSANNIILVNLEFDNDWPDYHADADPEGADAITIFNSRDIWIHHCEFKRWRDGAIDIKEYSSGSFRGDVERVSVTWSKFSQIYQAFLWEGDRLTLSHNVAYPGVGTRFPKIIAHPENPGNPARAHSYNNYIAGWAGKNIQHAKGGGELYSQSNIYESGSKTSVNIRESEGKIWNDTPYSVNTVEFLGGNDALDSSFVSEATSYANVELCSTPSCWTELKSRLLNGDSIHEAAGASL
ncbi:hypothetical protein [Sorangium sp. So ce1078]|uniref:hypothetical protein n=1 Tax=Sorangium sp. So ce1078 TaxID=3133329 RepID=UPI003F613C47